MAACLIKGAHVLDPDRPVEQCDIRVEDGRIAEMGPCLAPRGEETIDAEGLLAMPGLINAHTHSGQSLDRGTTPNLPLDLWLAWAVFGSVPRSADDAYTTAAAGALEMLQTGCTSVLDHVYLPHGSPEDFAAHGEAVVAAYSDVGLRAGVAPMVGDLPFAQTVPVHLLADGDAGSGASAGAAGDAAAGLPPEPALDPGALAGMVGDFLAAHRGRHRRVSPLVGPSAFQRCSDDFLERLAGLARRHGVGVHTHLLETKSQIFAGRHRWGRSTVAQARAMGFLGRGSSLAHAVWVDGDEIEMIAASGAAVVHNPCSNLRCGSGVMPAVEMAAAGVPVAVGADGAASNDNQNMFEALKLATLLPTLAGDHRRWPTAEEVWARSLRGGASALGLPVGRLAPGSPADIVLLELDRHVLAERPQLVASLVYAEHGESVNTVIVHGETVVRDGRSTRVDHAELGRRARGLQRRLHENTAERTAVFEQWRPALEAIEDAVSDIPVGITRRLP